MSSADSLERLFSLHPKLIDLSLGRIERLLAALDHPEQRLPPVIHIAGTNGKGSVAAFLRAMLEAQGLRVQAYSSPHLVRFHERIRLSEGLISEEALLAVLDTIETVNDGQPITFFEATTVAAFQAFAADDADYCLLEVGLGGKFDATNVIVHPAATIITPVAMDHQGFLGDKLSGIAAEKAGILKAGAPAFVAKQDPEAMAVIADRAAELGVEMLIEGEDWLVVPAAEGFLIETKTDSVLMPMPALPGAHQCSNAALAYACLQGLGQAGTPEQQHQALADVSWPGRLQNIDSGPLADLREGRGQLMLDGGHNVHGAQAIAKYYEHQQINVIVGLLENRELRPYLAELAPIADRLAAVPVPGESGHDPRAIAREAESLGIVSRAFDDVESALEMLPDGDTLIVGSLYLVGHVLEQSGLIPK